MQTSQAKILFLSLRQISNGNENVIFFQSFRKNRHFVVDKKLQEKKEKKSAKL